MNAQAQAIPITEQEYAKKVFTMFMQNGMGKEKSDVESLLKHIGYMESQFEKVFDELQNVRSQLQTIEDKSLKATVTRIVDTADTKITEAKTQFTGMKDGVLQSFSDTVDAVKEKGVNALKNTIDFPKVHSALSCLKGKLEQAVSSLQRGVSRIEDVKTELYAAKSHAHSAGRLMLGKEPKDAPTYNPNRGVLAGVQKALSNMGVLLTNIGKVTDSAMHKIEGLGQWKEESSVGRFIKNQKAAQTDRKTSAPEKESKESR